MNDQAARERFEALWAEHHRAVHAYVLRRIDDRDAAADVTSETFLVAWRRLEHLPEPPLPWLLGVARKTVANARRGSGRAQALIARLEREPEDRVVRDPAHGEDDGLAAERVMAAFNRLADGDRDVLSLIVWEGLAPREAAAVLGIAAPRFSVRLHRAKQRLRQQLDRPFDPADASSDAPASAPPVMEHR
ncbi:RNA polymerase sigma factor [Patulibacter defluvii]|uniref:RNA polymerase sigma factor n=1 Tax=Patulibacter defluvii TaxID=3095358 RepID=UPI002A75406C|nr:RNA polymerase sigma factor [Patulibacter sp. DM4]